MSSLYIRNRTQENENNWVRVKLGGGGDIIALSTDFTIGETVSLEPDETAQSKQSLTGTVEASGVTIFSTELKDVTFGPYVLVLRTQFNKIDSKDAAIVLKLFSKDTEGEETLLKTKTISPGMFNVANTWEYVDINLNFYGTQNSVLKIVCSSPSEEEVVSTDTVYKIDYIKLLSATGAPQVQINTWEEND